MRNIDGKFYQACYPELLSTPPDSKVFSPQLSAWSYAYVKVYKIEENVYLLH